MRGWITLVTSALLHAPASGQAILETLEDRPVGEVFVDEPGDGSIWARGETYKIRFSREGVEYFPFFGAQVPRNFPLALRLEGPGVLPIREGHRVAYDRGPLVEIWDLRAREVEQSFVLREAPGSGEIALRLAVETELSFAGADGGLVFEAPGLGFVRYGDAIAFDARGASTERPAQFAEGRIEISLPEDFLAAATYPVTIDPVVSTFAVQASASDHLAPDVAYDFTNDVWCVAYLETFSATDHDVLSRRLDGAGTPLDLVYQDMTTADAGPTSIANNAFADQFLIVWSALAPISLGLNDVWGRTRNAANSTQGPLLTIASTSFPEINPDVAGDPGGASSHDRYLVVWERGGANAGIYGRRVRTDGTLEATLTIYDTSEDERAPAVTKSCGAPGFWMIVHERSSPAAATDVFFEALPRTGPLVASGVVNGSTANDRDPDVAGDGDEFLVVWEREIGGGDFDVVASHHSRTGLSFPIVNQINLSASEPGAPAAAAQTDPSVETDGCRFVYVYRESASPAFNQDAYAATVLLAGTSVSWHEGHVPLQTSPVQESGPKIASRAGAGGVAGRYMATWDTLPGVANHDVRGAIWHGTLPAGGVTVIPTGCGSPEPFLVYTSLPALGAAFNVSGAPGGANLLAWGLPASPPLPLCPSQAGCSLGVDPIFATVGFFVPASFATTIPCNPALLGGTVAFQAFDLGGTGGCAPPLWPIAFSASDTIQVTVQ